MIYPRISIIIATSNSEKTLSTTLSSIKKQTYPKSKIEVLIIDGRSQDKTRQIAKKFGYKVIDNPQIGFIPAKHLGFVKAGGKYLMYLDSDEELESRNSLKLKVSTFESDKRIKGIMGSGYKHRKSESKINHYINEFGDPFSAFIYKSSMTQEFFIKNLQKKYKKILETKDFVAFDFSKTRPLPLIELVAVGSMIDLDFFKKNFPSIKKNPSLVAHFFYLLNTKNCLFAVTKNDSVIHLSCDSVKKYLGKISWRVKSNIYRKETIGAAGFEGRDTYQPFWFRFKRYLFIPYSLTFVFSVIDGLHLAITRRDSIFLLHPLLSVYTASLIIYHFILKSLGIRPNLHIYGR